MKTLGDKKGLDHGLNDRRFFLVVQKIGVHSWHLTKYSVCPVKLLSDVAVIVSLTFSLLSSVLTSKFRTPSELHNDNFSLSTIAEGSHPNVRKHCDPPRSPPSHCLCLGSLWNAICQVIGLRICPCACSRPCPRLWFTSAYGPTAQSSEGLDSVACTGHESEKKGVMPCHFLDRQSSTKYRRTVSGMAHDFQLHLSFRSLIFVFFSTLRRKPLLFLLGTFSLVFEADGACSLGWMGKPLGLPEKQSLWHCFESPKNEQTYIHWLYTPKEANLG